MHELFIFGPKLIVKQHWLPTLLLQNGLNGELLSM